MRVDRNEGARPVPVPRHLVRYVVAHLLAAIGEWTIFIAILVLVYERDGTTALGLASIALLLPYVVVSPIAGRLAEQRRPARVRAVGLAGQAVGFGLAALAAYVGAPSWFAVASGMFGLASLTSLRPAEAVLLPALVRSSRQLTTSNLWIGHAESSSALLGPLVATALLAVDGARFALAGSAGVAAVALVVATIDLRIDPPPAAARGGPGSLARTRETLRSLAGRPWARGVLVASACQYVLLGALDIVVVVSAEDVLDLGETGVGVLSTLVGIGAALSLVVNTLVVRRRRLAPALTLSLAAVAAACVIFGVRISLLVAVVTLPLLGLSQAVLDLSARMLLQRSAPPDALGSLFALIELTSGLGLLAGSLFAQLLIALDGVGTAMVGVGTFCALVLLATQRSLRAADAGADVPVVEMSLLRLDPVLSPLPTWELEAVARAGTEVDVAPGERVVVQGEPGDSYYVVADGRLDVDLDGSRIRSLERGQGFGEIALLADVPRTATVVAATASRVLQIDRRPFLVALTGHDASRQAAWGAVRAMELGTSAAQVLGAERATPPDR